jgi:L-ascorbate metabolism protein UlaG (beta-lactamase superfamily)
MLPYAATADTAPAPLDITYIGNEGFVIEGGGKKVIIDALYTRGGKGYVVHPPERVALMVSGEAPFDNVDLVLTTHFHFDHFDPQTVGHNLVSNPHARFVSTPDAVDGLAEAFDRYGEIKDRVVAVFPPEGHRETVEYDDLRIEIVNLHHGRGQRVQNLGFIVHIAGNRILHVGDTQAEIGDFQRNNLHVEEFDYAFVPYWFLSYPTMRRALIKGVKARTFVAMHMPPKELKPSHLRDLGGFDAAVKQMHAKVPNSIIFPDEMSRKFLASESR